MFNLQVPPVADNLIMLEVELFNSFKARHLFCIGILLPAALVRGTGHGI